ncbi:MAG: DEAD/DEAH box helicase family protein [Bacteroidales bacterium]|nr:DEAD/DEAH box helicase family protein [Bacteroidales bacterium]
MLRKRNQNPEQIARDKIDEMLQNAGWAVQSKKETDLSAAQGVAIREYQTDIGFADYLLFVNRKPVGIIEAKREDEGHRLITAEDQSYSYAIAKLKYYQNKDPLSFVYESTGTVTRFTDYRDPKPRGRNIFSFHQPQTIAEWLKREESLRQRLLRIPELNPTGLRKAQVGAIQRLETSFKNNRPKALIQMATGAGKTYTAATFIYRLLKFADAKRILFLVDTRNLGEQAEQEFQIYQPNDDNRRFKELYNVQLLRSNYIASDSQVCISTIQRLYSILKGEELDESAEEDNPNESSSWLQQQLSDRKAVPVEYTPNVPIELFDFIVIDECHRSIYNLWKQVLDYFDAFLIGITATPDKRTFGFFNQNVVSEYTYEESVVDGVNVPYDVYTIETQISRKGSTVKAGWYVDRRDKLTREKRWQQEDEDTQYERNDLDKKVVNTSQIRTIIKEFKRALETEIFPNRVDSNGEYEVPKTLVFAKTDSHADDIIRIIREEFNEGNKFCKKVTYKIDEDPKSLLNRFRNAYYPRIAVTVDMIATGTDIQALEVLLFMRDVKSINYFEQMKGRGTRTITRDSLQRVSRTAVDKTHFVVVDAVGVTKSKKTDSRPLERKHSIPLKDLLGAVKMGVTDEDLFLSLANRLIRLDKQIKQKDQEQLLEYSGGKSLKQITQELIAAYDEDSIYKKAKPEIEKIPTSEHTPDLEEDVKKKAQQELIAEAAKAFTGTFCDFIENVRLQHEQIIDHINIDEVTTSEWDSFTQETAEQTILEFTQYIESNKDEIQALSIFYNQPYNRRYITYKMLKEVMDKLQREKPTLSPNYVWDAYVTLEKSNHKNIAAERPKSELTTLVSIIRKACGIDKELKPYDKTINENFKKWIFKQNAGQHNRFTPEQMDWLRMIKDHMVSSCHIEVDDLNYVPFNEEGGIGKMYQLFGDEMNRIIEELNEAMAA